MKSKRTIFLTNNFNNKKDYLNFKNLLKDENFNYIVNKKIDRKEFIFNNKKEFDRFINRNDIFQYKGLNLKFYRSENFSNKNKILYHYRFYIIIEICEEARKLLKNKQKLLVLMIKIFDINNEDFKELNK